MGERLAILGGSPAITLDHTYYAQWPIYTEEEVETVSALIRNSGLSSAHYDPDRPDCPARAGHRRAVGRALRAGSPQRDGSPERRAIWRRRRPGR